MGVVQLPKGQAEIVFGDSFVEYLADLRPDDQLAVLAEVVRLCDNPVGKHPLSNHGGGDNLAGWNTLDVLGGEHRVVFSVKIVEGVGTIDVLCAGPRRADAAYALASALIATGKLDSAEVSELFAALALLEVVAEKVGLDGWDYVPETAPEGMRRAAVASGLLTKVVADVLSKDEIEAAMSNGWTANGPDPIGALRAALRRARSSVAGNVVHVLQARSEPRCAALMPRVRAKCIRREGHPGPHRSSA